jgi:2-polyprenyl-3-methyl-5-hydroxy-6-metoxy-1,4-benzoquinol methylase
MPQEQGYPERIVPARTEPGIVSIHLKRYEFAAPVCTGGQILDAACGVGYGSAYLADVAARVVGVDVDPEAIAYATTHYGRPGVEFVVGDVSALPFPPDSFDAACSFETIEHVTGPETVLGELARVVRPGGAVIVSTPNAPRTTRAPRNPFHRTEWSAADFAELLRGFFPDVTLYGQRRRQTRAHRVAQRLDVLGLRRRSALIRRAGRLTGTAPTDEASLDDLVIEEGRIAGATEIVAVCRVPSP